MPQQNQAPANHLPASSDFNDIRQRIIDYLKQKPEFSDYNFEGSALSTLIDILAYVAHYFSIQANMVFSERFLDSAVIRDNIVSIAQELGYFPSAGKAAKAIVSVFIPQSVVQNYDALSYFTIKTTDQLVGQDEFGNSFPFVVGTNTDLQKGFHPITFQSGFYGKVEILQGQREEYMLVYENQSSEFFIDANGIDFDTLEIEIVSPTGERQIMKNAKEAFGLLPSIQNQTYFYFIRQISGKLHVYFSDGSIGLEPPVGSTIYLRFIRCDGAAGNNCGNFKFVNPLEYFDPVSNTYKQISTQDIVVETDQLSFGGEDAETPNRIRTFAPLVYQAQDRAITTSDYKGLLAQKFPWIADINVWGGEDNIPPQYGYVFLAIKPRNNTIIPPSIKRDILNFIKQKRALGIVPKIIDPEYIHLNVFTKIFVQNTLYGAEDITKTKTTIQNFIDNISNKFNQTFYYSKLLETIDNASTNILGNETTITISKVYNSHKNNFIQLSDINFMAPIKQVENVVWQDEQGFLYELRDDRNGNLILYIGGKQQDVIGQIDYNLGTVKIINYTFKIKPNSVLEFQAIPNTHTIQLKNNAIFQSGKIDVQLA